MFPLVAIIVMSDVRYYCWFGLMIFGFSPTSYDIPLVCFFHGPLMGTGLSRLTFNEGLSLAHFLTSDTKSNVCTLEAKHS